MKDIQGIDWNEVWKERKAQRTSSARSPAFWNKRAPSFVQHASRTGYAEAFLEIMKPKRHWSVLDFGCGGGTLAIPMADKVKTVTAVDYSDAMLQTLEEVRKSRKIENIRTVNASWETDWAKAGIGVHDIAIASRSLVVEDLRASIEKLNGAARRRVYITTVVGDGPHDRRIFDAIGRKLDTGPDYIYNYNLLYQMGIHADITFITERNHKTYSGHDDAAASFEWMLGDTSSEEEEGLKNYLQTHLIHDGGQWVMDYEHTIRWAVIWWSKE